MSAFSANEQLIAVAADYGLSVYSTNSWRRVLLRHGGAFQVASMANPNVFVFMDAHGVSSLQPNLSSKRLFELPSEAGWIITRDGTSIVVRTLGRLLVYDLATKQLLKQHMLASGYSGDMVEAWQGVALAAWGSPAQPGGWLWFYPLRGQVMAHSLHLEAHPYSLAYCQKIQTLFIGTTEGTIYSCPSADHGVNRLGQPLHQIVECLACSPIGNLIAAGYQSDIKGRNPPFRNRLLIIDSHTGKVLQTITRTDGVQSVSFSPDGKLLAECDRGGKLNIFQVQ